MLKVVAFKPVRVCLRLKDTCVVSPCDGLDVGTETGWAEGWKWVAMLVSKLDVEQVEMRVVRKVVSKVAGRVGMLGGLKV